ncbi:MAG: hypothetical protein L0Z50_07200, partial [Verrucomicrobiales bacterium]|nr:hypothetical protein [Verrucomicrobiales bacterium]
DRNNPSAPRRTKCHGANLDEAAGQRNGPVKKMESLAFSKRGREISHARDSSDRYGPDQTNRLTTNLPIGRVFVLKPSIKSSLR